MGKYEELSRKALEALGGVENITHVTHCATRLRISYARKSVVNEEGLKDLPGSAGIVNKDKQIQIIIGPGVHDAYEEFLEISGWREGGAVAAEEEEETGPKNAMYYLNKFGNFVAPIFMPVVPAMITGGMILAIKNLLVNYFGMGVDSGTAQLMLMIFDAGFAFLPVYVGYTLASQLKMQPIMGAFLGATLIAPRFATGTVTDFFGIGIPQVSYSSTVIPIVLGVFFMYYVQKVLKKDHSGSADVLLDAADHDDCRRSGYVNRFRPDRQPAVRLHCGVLHLADQYARLYRPADPVGDLSVHGYVWFG